MRTLAPLLFLTLLSASFEGCATEDRPYSGNIDSSGHYYTSGYDEQEQTAAQEKLDLQQEHESAHH
jgi:hypothetical protein